MVSVDLRQVAFIINEYHEGTGEYPEALTPELLTQRGWEDPHFHSLILEEGFRYQQPPRGVEPAQLDDERFVIIDYRNDLGHWLVFPDTTVEYRREVID